MPLPRLRLTGLCALFLFCCACTYTLSQRPPYQAYVNKDVTLEEDVMLYERKISDATFWKAPAPLPRGELYRMAETGSSWESSNLTEAYYDKLLLKKGTPLVISGVYVRSTGLGGVKAKGRIYAESLGKWLPFEYQWPELPEEKVKAPWEKEAISSRP